jgi:DNA-binding CsgD family transcriptional regulator
MGRGESFVGRRSELAALHECLTASRRAAPQLVAVEGVAGIGKTSLVRRFLAEEPTVVVWSSGDEDEVGLPWGVLGQLARSAAALGSPQLSELVTGLDPQADPVMVGAGLLKLVGSDEPFVVVIDDAHWADPQSLAAARFAFRRLVSEKVLVLITYRPSEFGRLGEGWRRLLGSEQATRLPLQGLGTKELSELVTVDVQFDPVRPSLQGLGTKELSELARVTHGRPLSARATARLEEQTSGHPLYVRSLLEQLPLSTIERSEGPLPAPADLASAVSARVASRSEAAQEVVAVAAVMGRSCRIVDLAQACSLGSSPDFTAGLEEALGSGLLLEVPGTGGAELEFSHVLVRSAVYYDLSPRRRRELHTRAAAALAGTASLAHRVAAAVGPDPALADELGRAARAHFSSGRLSQGASELKRSPDLTPAGPSRRARLLETAEALLIAGDVAGAGELSEELSALGTDAWCDYVTGYLALLQARVSQAESVFQHAWGALERGEAPEGAPVDLKARVASQLAIIGIVRLDYRAMTRFGEAAVKAGAEDRRTAQFAWFARTIGLSLSGRSNEALDLLARLDQAEGPGGLDAVVARGMVRLWTDDLAGAHDDLSRALERAELGEPLRVSQGIGYLGEVAFRSGQLDEAVLYGELALAVQAATEGGRVWDLAILHALASYPRAARGDLEEAAVHAKDAAQWAALMGTSSARAYAAAAGAAVASANDDAQALYDSAVELTAAYEAVEPGAHVLGPVLARSLLALGRIDEAARELAKFEQRVAVSSRRSSLMVAERTRGMLSALRGDWLVAQTHLQKAVTLGEELRMPLEVALSQLEWGRAAMSSSGDRKAAIRHLSAAMSRFKALGAGAYVSVAGGLLHGLGVEETEPEAGSLGIGLLTPSEAAVVRLVSARLSNSEVARQLIMSPKTVEYHLTHVYAKLGVRSRRELALALRFGP